MNFFSVFVKPQSTHDGNVLNLTSGKKVILRQSFKYIMLVPVFNVLYLFYNKYFRLGSFVLLLLLIPAVGLVAGFIKTTLNIILSLCAKDLMEWELKKGGYVFLCAVMAKKPTDAFKKVLTAIVD